MTGTDSKLSLPSPELQSALEAHRQWLENPDKGARLAVEGFDFSGLDLRGYSFQLADLAYTEWVNCDLNSCDFSHAELTGSLFRDSNLINCHFEEAILSGATFGGTQLLLDGARFDNALTQFTSFPEPYCYLLHNALETKIPEPH